jgi:bifunctional UDP-N-acetylglucosamine pyrophosphorylase/glucosamine-1-phosphate N-acetyltransferase
MPDAGKVAALVLAAGKGTRMKSAFPKVIHDICGRPMLWWVLSALADAQIREITLVVNAENEASAAAIAHAVPSLSARTTRIPPSRWSRRGCRSPHVSGG